MRAVIVGVGRWAPDEMYASDARTICITRLAYSAWLASMSSANPYAYTNVEFDATSHFTSLAFAITTNSCTYVRNPRVPALPIVMVRCTGICVFVRSAECARATARSIDVVV